MTPLPPTPRDAVRRWRIEALLALLTLLFGIAAALAFYYGYDIRRAGPEQPIAFSYRVHVATKEISCMFCHPGAADTPRAGLPPLETCMLCHSRIIMEHPEIRKLREKFADNLPVEWVRVYNVHDFVYFDHQAHVRSGFDCGECHGNIAAMDRVGPQQDFKMGVCVQCHRDNNASHDCLTCHR